MLRKFLTVGAAIALAANFASAAFAAAHDYSFELAKAEIKKGDDVTVAVHLVHKPTGKRVVQTRIDMVPDGMAAMTSPLTRGQAPKQASALRVSRADPDARASLIQSNAMATALLLLPIGLGLLGFLEPGSIGATLIFIKHFEGQNAINMPRA
jgi:hypothetical protein